MLEAPAGCDADAVVERHVRVRAAALTRAARGVAKAAQAAALARPMYYGYDEEECHRARAQQLWFMLAAWQPAFGAVVAADGETVRFCRYDGAAADPDAPPRWTPPLPLSYAGSEEEGLPACMREHVRRLKRAVRVAPPEGFCRLFQLLYAEPAALGQRLRIPGLLARLLADPQPDDDDAVAGRVRSLVAHELRSDARQLRDAAWLLGHGQRVRAYLLPASLRRRYFPEERGPAFVLCAGGCAERKRLAGRACVARRESARARAPQRRAAHAARVP